jgi:hypothetical protein
MSPTQRLLLNAIVLAALLVMQPLTFSLGFSRLAAFYFLVGMGLWAANKADSGEGPPALRRSERWVWIATVGFIAMHVLRESLDYANFVGDFRSGIKLGLTECATAVALVAIGLRHRASGTIRFLSIVVIAVGAYVALNLALEVTGLMPGTIEQGFQSRYVEGGLRWMPPLAKSNGLFSLLNRYALSMGLLMLVCARRSIQPIVGSLIALSVVSTAYAAILLEHRAAVIPILVAPTAYAFARMKRYTLAPWSALIAMIIVPIVIGSGWWQRSAEALLPRSAFEVMGDPATVYTLSDRDSIYQYGLEYASAFKMGLWGDGPVFRDAAPGFPEASRMAIEAALSLGAPAQTFAFHNGLLDLLIPYGPLFTLLFLIIIATAISSLGGSDPFVTRMCVANLAVLLAVNVLDGGFSDVNLLFLTLVTAAISTASIRTTMFNRTPSAATPRTRAPHVRLAAPPRSARPQPVR